MENDEEKFENFVYVVALENALNYGGNANPKALIGKCVPLFPFIKKDMQHYMNTIENICGHVNGLSNEEKIEKLKILNPNYFEKKKVKKEEKKPKLIEFETMEKGKVVTRFAPAPSGNLHLGHLYGVIYNYVYAKEFEGKFYLRIEDTNPENVELANYDAIINDIRWLVDNGISEVFYQSDRIEIYYEYLKKLFESSKAYVCECDADVFKTYNDSSSSCPHRNLSLDLNLKKFQKILNGDYAEGEVCIRFKGDLENKNPALRDFSLARIKKHSHPRLKNDYILWPMYNLCSAVDDFLMGITHVIRGKDHEINGIRQDMIKDALNFKKSEYFHYGRIKFLDIELSKSKLSELIENGVYSGWDDPRVPSLLSHKKKGYKAEAFRNMIIQLGISKRDSKISKKEYYKNLNFFNKQILEKEANRYFFIEEPVNIKIKNLEDYLEKNIILPKHPEIKERGKRVFNLGNEFIIEKKDYSLFEVGDKIRLMHFANFVVESKDVENNTLELTYISKEYDKNLNLKKNIHFLPKNNNKNAIVIMDDNSQKIGFCEHLGNLQPDTSLQFERFGFVKFDRKEKDNLIFYYTHN